MNVRDAFFDEIYRYTREGNDICIVSADIGAPSLDKFRRDFGDRFINVGIAEQNLLSVSAGLALAGKRVVAYGLNPFPVTRALDQMRALLEGMRIPFTLTGLNAGTCSAEAGYTHMPLENLAVVRTLSHIRCVTPSDEVVSRAAAYAAVFDRKPMYIQFDKMCNGQLYPEGKSVLSGAPLVYGDGQDAALITYGCFVKRLRSLLPLLEEKGINAKILDCCTLPVDEEALARELKTCRAAVSVEDGRLTGGLGSLVLEMMNEKHICMPFKRLGLVGDYSNILLNRAAIHQRERLDNDNLIEAILSFAATAELGESR